MNRTYWENQLKDDTNFLVFETRSTFCMSGKQKSGTDVFSDSNGRTWSNTKSVETVVNPKERIYVFFDRRLMYLSISGRVDTLTFRLSDDDISFLSSFEFIGSVKFKITNYLRDVYILEEWFLENEVLSESVIAKGDFTLLEVEDFSLSPINFDDEEDMMPDFDDNHIATHTYYLKAVFPSGSVGYFELHNEVNTFDSYVNWYSIDNEELIAKIEQAEVYSEQSFSGQLIERQGAFYSFLLGLNEKDHRVEFFAYNEKYSGEVMKRDSEYNVQRIQDKLSRFHTSYELLSGEVKG